MTRDPAFLFYDGDASRDVSHMNRLERGCYFDLIQAQKKFGGFTIEQARKILGNDFDCCWPSIELILINEDGKFFIDWLRESIEKRKIHAEKQRKRIQDYWDKKKKENTTEIPRNNSGYSLENENENENENEEVKEKEIIREFRECSELLKTRILERRQQKITDETLFKWDNTVRLMIYRDGRVIDDIKFLIDECHDMEPTASGFTWRNNILSMDKLRQQWNDGKIYVGMNRKSQQKQNTQYPEPDDIPILKLD